MTSWLRPGRLPILLLILGGLVTRVVFLHRWTANFDADEALVAVQAAEILRGHFGLFLPGQSYMGSIQSLLAAPWIGIFGAHATAVRLSPLLWLLPGFLALRALLRMGRRGARAGEGGDRVGPAEAEAGAGSGPDRRAPWGWPLVLAWLFPPAVLFLSGVKARGGNLEGMVLGLWAAALLWPRAGDEGRMRRLGRTAGGGLLLGLALWTHDQSLIFLPLAVILVFARRKDLPLRALCLAAGLFVGYLPFWLPRLAPFALGPPGLEGAGVRLDPAAAFSPSGLRHALQCFPAALVTARAPGFQGFVQALYLALTLGAVLFCLRSWLWPVPEERPNRASRRRLRELTAEPAICVTLWVAAGTTAALTASPDYFDDPQWFRYTLGTAPFLVVASAIALARLPRRWAVAAGLALPVVSGLVSIRAVPGWVLPQAAARPVLVSDLLAQGIDRVHTDWRLAYVLRFLSKDRILASSYTPPRFPEINAAVDLAPRSSVVVPGEAVSADPEEAFLIAPFEEVPPEDVAREFQRLDPEKTLFAHYEPFPLLEDGQFHRDWRGWPYRRPLDRFQSILFQPGRAEGGIVPVPTIEEALRKQVSEGGFTRLAEWPGGIILQRAPAAGTHAEQSIR